MLSRDFIYHSLFLRFCPNFSGNNQRTFLPAMEVHRRELGCGGIHHMDVPQSHNLRVQVVPRFGLKMGSPDFYQIKWLMNIS